MRPPEFSGGNVSACSGTRCLAWACFNEAAGIHRRKLSPPRRRLPRRAPLASMRPPEFTGGNVIKLPDKVSPTLLRFNEAAGIHRRKLEVDQRALDEEDDASMRPPEFTGGNSPSVSISNSVESFALQ